MCEKVVQGQLLVFLFPSSRLRNVGVRENPLCLIKNTLLGLVHLRKTKTALRALYVGHTPVGIRLLTVEEKPQLDNLVTENSARSNTLKIHFCNLSREFFSIY